MSDRWRADPELKVSPAPVALPQSIASSSFCSVFSLSTERMDELESLIESSDVSIYETDPSADEGENLVLFFVVRRRRHATYHGQLPPPPPPLPPTTSCLPSV